MYERGTGFASGEPNTGRERVPPVGERLRPPVQEGELSGWDDLQLLGRVGVVITVPAVLVAGPVLGIFIGSALDRRWHTAPWVLVVLAACGMIGSSIEVYRILRWIARLSRQ